MNVRQAIPDDAPKLAQLGALTFTHTFGHMYAAKDLQVFLESNYTIEKHIKAINDPRESFWLLEDDENDGEILAFGWVGTCTLPVANLESNAGEIKRFYVHPDHQGKKLGSRLFKKMLAWLEEKEYSPLYLGVWSENYGAQRLYARYGFKKVGEHYFVIGNHRDLDFIYKRAD
ncbi:hypothetical protein BGX28_004636 [Mortierella sp. GBA30]|nr:hypothetical protein BGX28_004636 [Mortierella sp. GBA30]